MNKLILLFATLVVTNLSLAGEATIQVTGKGKVTINNSTQICEDKCIIDTSESDLKLSPEADSGWYFSGWLDQKCDMGEQVLTAEKYSKIANVRGGAKTLTTLDINADGIDDLISISLFDGKIMAYLNQGDGTFITSTIDAGLSYPSALKSIDWDNDNDIDLLVADYGAAKIKLYLNNGNNQFIFEKDFIFSNTRPYAFSVADYNKDAKLDFIISSFNADRSGDLFALVSSISSAKISWFINQEEAFVEQASISNNAAITLDTYQSLDDDYPQVLTAEIAEGRVALYTANSGGVYQQRIIDTSIASYGAAFGDIDQNGYIDILATYYRPSKIKLIYGQADNTFSAPTIIDQPSEGVTATSFGDYNNDNYIDVAVGEFNANIFYFYKTNSFKNCIVKQSTNIVLTAEFKQKAQSTTPETEVEKSPSSSGGSMSWLMLIVLISFRRFMQKIN